MYLLKQQSGQIKLLWEWLKKLKILPKQNGSKWRCMSLYINFVWHPSAKQLHNINTASRPTGKFPKIAVIVIVSTPVIRHNMEHFRTANTLGFCWHNSTVSQNPCISLIVFLSRNTINSFPLFDPRLFSVTRILILLLLLCPHCCFN